MNTLNLLAEVQGHEGLEWTPEATVQFIELKARQPAHVQQQQQQQQRQHVRTQPPRACRGPSTTPQEEGGMENDKPTRHLVPDWALKDGHEQYVMVGELKTVKVLLRDGRRVLLFQARGDKNVENVQKQVYTYMVVTCTEFGWLSCYKELILVWRPTREDLLDLAKHDPDLANVDPDLAGSVLLFSRAIGHKAAHPEVTIMGAMCWEQNTAIKHMFEDGKVHPKDAHPPPSDDDSEGGASDAGSDAAKDAQGGRGRGGRGGRGSGGGKGKVKLRFKSGAQGSRQRARGQDNVDTVMLPVLHYSQILVHEECRLGRGVEGVVLRGTCDGAEVAVKAFISERTCRREAAAYQVALSLQGSVLPRLLGVGTLYAGVPFMAISLVRGRLLSALDEIPHEVAEAAVDALRQLHRAGLAWGDVRLCNMMLQEPCAPQPQPGRDDAEALAASSGSASTLCLLQDEGQGQQQDQGQGQQQDEGAVDAAALVAQGRRNTHSSCSSAAAQSRPRVVLFDLGMAYVDPPNTVKDEEIQELMGVLRWTG